jgi:hypothetical protein
LSALSAKTKLRVHDKIPDAEPQFPEIPDGTLYTLHVRVEHIVLVVALGVCLVLWSRLCSISAKLALLEAASDLTKK